MALDTEAKRASSPGWGLPWLRALPFPTDSGADTSAERAAVLGLYSMAAGGGEEPGSGGSTYTGFVLNVARLMTR